ncbi:MAG: hypothetical protein KA792_04990, partial [Bacteroidales bacterium]|nr:hypothetical protein [Bacteroidales bacterium]
MKKLLLSISFIIVLSNLSAQKIATKNISYDPFIKRKSNLVLLQNFEKTFIISKYKTTNKEYLCFLQWNYRVFGVDYPEVYKAMLPDTIKYPDIFKPEKLNMLVKGISKKQAQAFCQWRTDRLNEYILIREGILRKDFNQVNEENFNTEAYLSFQYEGNVKNDLLDKFTKKVRPVTQRDFILVPSFYISSKEEIKICNSLNRISKIKNKRKVKSDFDWWFKNEFFILKNSDNNSPFSILKSRLGENKLSNKHKIRSFVRKNKKELAKEIINYDTTVII